MLMTAHTKNHQPDVLIVGLGPTGLSVARHFGRKGIAFKVTDSRAEPPGMDDLINEFPDAPRDFGGFHDEFFAAAQQLVVSPGVAVATPQVRKAQQQGAEIIGDIELFVREAQVPIIAITGSNGKSSVTKLVELMAQKAGMSCYAIGNIGRFVMDVLPESVPDLYVMELSSFQLETTQSLRAAAAVVLNVCEDHLDRYTAFNDYVAAKAVVYQGCQHPVLNRDDTVVTAMSELPNYPDAPALSFGLSEPVSDSEFGLRTEQDQRYFARGQRCLMPIAEMRLPGEHNVSNALAGLALGAAAGIPEAAMLRAIREFKGLPHRTEWIRERLGVHWFNDSKGTNVGATVAALQGLPGMTVLIAGGQGKGADFAELAPIIREHARAVVVMGEDAALIAEQVDTATPLCRVSSMQEAVTAAAELAQSGDNVLLSPACASFDMFDNYMQRGEMFVAAVRGLSA